MKKLFLFFAFTLICLARAHAWDWNQSDEIDGYYGFRGDWNVAGRAEKAGTIVRWHIGNNYYSQNLYIATKLTMHGAKFCQFYVWGNGSQKIDTRYNSNFDTCHWLCESGYGGEECAQATGYCDSSEILGVSATGRGAEAESAIPMFDGGARDDGGDENDWVLALTDIKKHGATAQIVRIQANGTKGKPNTIDIHIYSPVTKKMLCKNGYKPNAAGTDCEAVSAAQCEMSSKTLCDGFSSSKYDSSIHMLETSTESSKCTFFKCSASGQAFPSAGNFTCAECGASLKNGVSSTNGVCIKCDTGKIFKDNACVDATPYTNAELQYGKGNNKNSKTCLMDDCWTILDPVQYKNCVASSVWQNPEITGAARSDCKK